MPNKKIKKNKLKSKGIFKKGLATFLAVTIGLGSGAALSSLNGGQITSAATIPKLRDIGSPNKSNQTRIMMDGNNFLKNGFWMNAVVEDKGTTFNATLRFTIPGYDMSNLKFFVMSKNSKVAGVTEVPYSTENQNITLTNLAQTTYDVHVYNGSLATENFVCKAEFVTSHGTWASTVETDLLDGDGNPIMEGDTGLKLTYHNLTDWDGAYQVELELPRQVVPYNCRTIKVVLFATDRNGEPINIDHTLFDLLWIWDNYNANTGVVHYNPEALWGKDAGVTYEAHFYKDDVLPENFVCKAIGIDFSTNPTPVV